MPLAWLLPLALSSSTLPQDPLPKSIGWHDELNRVSTWNTISPEHPAQVTVPVKGALQMSLVHVAAGWPYEYQWSGVGREATVDLAKAPFLVARVSSLLGGYAHMDIDVLDDKGKSMTSFRSSTIQAGGLVYLDCSEKFMPGTYRLRVRLILGGSNEGCTATYNWVRFMSRDEGYKLIDKAPPVPVETI